MILTVQVRGTNCLGTVRIFERGKLDKAKSKSVVLNTLLWTLADNTSQKEMNDFSFFSFSLLSPKSVQSSALVVQSCLIIGHRAAQFGCERFCCC